MSTSFLYQGYLPARGTIQQGKLQAPTVSFELYPPRGTKQLSQQWSGIDKLLRIDPNWVSVTYGAGGSTQSRSIEVLQQVIKKSPAAPLAHLTCIGLKRDTLRQLIAELLQAGLRDFLALRGDLPAGVSNWIPGPDELAYAVQLVSLIREVAAEVLPAGVPRLPRRPETAPNPADYVSIAVAAYPAGSSQEKRNNLVALKEKQDAGADFAITQVFYEASDYSSLVYEGLKAGINLPIIPGIIPLTDLNRLTKLEGLTKVEIPTWLRQLLQNPNPAQRVEQSLRATLNLCLATLEAGAPGIHLYSFNRPRPALDLIEYLRASGFQKRSLNRQIADRHRMPSADQAPRLDIDLNLVRSALSRVQPAA